MATEEEAPTTGPILVRSMVSVWTSARGDLQFKITASNDTTEEGLLDLADRALRIADHIKQKTS